MPARSGGTPRHRCGSARGVRRDARTPRARPGTRARRLELALTTRTSDTVGRVTMRRVASQTSAQSRHRPMQRTNSRRSLSPRSASAQLVQTTAHSLHASMQRTRTSRSPLLGCGWVSIISRIDTSPSFLTRGDIQDDGSRRDGSRTAAHSTRRTPPLRARLTPLTAPGQTRPFQGPSRRRRAAIRHAGAPPAEAPVINVPTITLEGDANGAPHPDPGFYAGMFSGPRRPQRASGRA